MHEIMSMTCEIMTSCVQSSASEEPSILHQFSCPENMNLVNSDSNVFGDAAGPCGSSFYANEILSAPANEIETTPESEGRKSAKKRTRKKVSELFTRRIKRSALDVHSPHIDAGKNAPADILFFFFPHAVPLPERISL